jgi:hypothetical protein
MRKERIEKIGKERDGVLFKPERTMAIHAFGSVSWLYSEPHGSHARQYFYHD